jgi:hypothetical protein
MWWSRLMPAMLVVSADECKLGALAVLVALFAALSLAASKPAAQCNAKVARQAVVATKLKLVGLGQSPTPVDPKQVDQVLCLDFTRDGRTDIAITIASGGTAGDIGYAVFAATATGWRILVKGDGYKLGLSRVADDVVLSQPVYKKNDPNCCPSGGFDHTRYHWNGVKAVAHRYHSDTYKP